MSKSNKIAGGVRLNQGISGGLGDHKAGTCLFNLSGAAYNTVVQGGLGEAIDELSKDDKVVYDMASGTPRKVSFDEVQAEPPVA